MIVGLDAIAIGERGAHRAGRREGANAEVHRRRRIPDEHVGRIVRRRAVHRLELREPRQHGCLGPCWLRQRAVDRRVGFDPRHLDVELSITTVVGGARVGQVGDSETEQ